MAGDLQVVVSNIRNARGLIQVGVCPQDRFLTETCPYNASAPAHPGETVVVVPNVPPGIWATQVYHDENMNEQVDRDLLGIPLEGIGFSNNAHFRFGPPSFADARFELGPPRRAHHAATALPELTLLKPYHSIDAMDSGP